MKAVCITALLVFITATAGAQQRRGIEAHRIPFKPRQQVGYVAYTQAEVDAAPIPVPEYRPQYYLGYWFAFLPQVGEWFYCHPRHGWIATDKFLYDPALRRTLNVREVVEITKSLERISASLERQEAQIQQLERDKRLKSSK